LSEFRVSSSELGGPARGAGGARRGLFRCQRAWRGARRGPVGGAKIEDCSAPGRKQGRVLVAARLGGFREILAELAGIGRQVTRETARDSCCGASAAERDATARRAVAHIRTISGCCGRWEAGRGKMRPALPPEDGLGLRPAPDRVGRRLPSRGPDCKWIWIHGRGAAQWRQLHRARRCRADVTGIRGGDSEPAA